jgi:hypothetical protein
VEALCSLGQCLDIPLLLHREACRRGSRRTGALVREGDAWNGFWGLLKKDSHSGTLGQVSMVLVIFLIGLRHD